MRNAIAAYVILGAMVIALVVSYAILPGPDISKAGEDLTNNHDSKN